MKWVSLFLIISSLLLSSCKYNEKPEFVRLDRIELGEMSIQTVNFEVDAVFTNGNDIGGKLVTENIDLYVDNVLVGNFKTEEFNVPARDTFLIPLKGKIRTDKILKRKKSDMLNQILAIVNSKKVTVRLEGDIVFKKGPFSHTYKVNKTDQIAFKL